MGVLRQIDIPTALTHFNISFDWSGDNIGNRHVGLGKCLYCDLPNNHFAINRYTGYLKCWQCEIHDKTLADLVSHHYSCELKKAWALIYQFADNDHETVSRPIYREVTPGTGSCLTGVELMRSAGYQREPLPQMASRYHDYLRYRRYDPKYVIAKYGLYFNKPGGPHARRIGLPHFHNGKIVAFQGLSTDRQPNTIRYLSSSKNAGPKTPKNLLYNERFVNPESPVIVCEGPMDAWRLGDNAVSLSGKCASPAQIDLLRKYKNVWLVFDADAAGQQAMHNLAKQLSVFTNVRSIKLAKGDPDDMSDTDVIELWSYILEN